MSQQSEPKYLSTQQTDEFLSEKSFVFEPKQVEIKEKDEMDDYKNYSDKE